MKEKPYLLCEDGILVSTRPSSTSGEKAPMSGTAADVCFVGTQSKVQIFKSPNWVSSVSRDITEQAACVISEKWLDGANV